MGKLARHADAPTRMTVVGQAFLQYPQRVGDALQQ
jgi:hypothetical protein